MRFGECWRGKFGMWYEKSPRNSPERDGILWLFDDAMRQAVVCIRDGKYFVSGGAVSTCNCLLERIKYIRVVRSAGSLLDDAKFEFFVSHGSNFS